MTTVPDKGRMSVFYATRFSSAGSTNEYANGCSPAGSVRYANTNTSLSYSSDALVLYVTNCLANVPAMFHSKHQRI